MHIYQALPFNHIHFYIRIVYNSSEIVCNSIGAKETSVTTLISCGTDSKEQTMDPLQSEIHSYWYRRIHSELLNLTICSAAREVVKLHQCSLIHHNAEYIRWCDSTV